MNKLPEPLYRALRTFLQAFVGFAGVSFYQVWADYMTSHIWSWPNLWWMVCAPGIAAGMSALMNIQNDSEE